MSDNNQYLITFFIKNNKEKIIVVNENDLFKLIQKYKNNELVEEEREFTVHKIGKCILDFS